jgi:iron complex outermembrane recepter protein
MLKRSFLLAGAALSALSAPALAEDSGTTAMPVFTLGEVTAATTAPDTAALGGSTLTQDDMRLFNRETLDKALDVLPGVSTSLVGARNETNIWVRGNDRWRVPLSIDGIPVYLPYDNRIDFSRFTTSDISEIQVSKGFASVLDGPNTLGGAINLVSRQVTQPFEGEMRVGARFDANGGFNGFTTDIFTGTRQDLWYIQGSVSESLQDHYRLSGDFAPGTYQGSGDRVNSRANDYKVNLKVGYTPNATDEYSINIIDQDGNKETPPQDTVMSSSSSVKFWKWPDWDKQSIYWLSKTEFDELGSYVKVRAYYDRFYNVLDIYDNAQYNTMNSTSAERSIYDDRAAGGSVEVAKVLFGGQDVLKGALHYNWNQHNSQNKTNANPGQWYEQPWLHAEEATTSVAAENTFHPAHNWDVIAGTSYDYRHIIHADDWNTLSAVNGVVPAPYGQFVYYAVHDKHAVNPELALAYHYSDTGAVHASVAGRTRFPTLFEMYSSRFGASVGNPALRPEESVNWEVGVSDTVDGIHLGGNLFYNRIMDAIESVSVYYPSLKKSYNQSQNVGLETQQGIELESSARVLPTVEIGGNYTFLVRKIANYATLATDTPSHKIFAYATWTPLDGLNVVPSMEINTKKWLQSAANSSYYYRGGDAAIGNLKVSYDITRKIQVEVGVNNIFDTNYVVEDGYNSEGRNYFTNVRIKF